MENEEKKNLATEVANENDDFAFVQQDEHIHDKKFETKPTTFFKDAMKRFAKNKSSVIAAGILATLILMAIIVPIADRNNIKTPVAAAKYLPPKWFSGNLNGFLDGTREIREVLDPETKKLPSDSSYVEGAILGDIKVSYSTSDTLDPNVKKYGSGGYVTFNNPGVTERVSREWSAGVDTGILSPTFEFEKTDIISYEVTLSSSLIEEHKGNGTVLSSYLAFSSNFGGSETVLTPLMTPVELDEDVASLKVDNVVSALESGGIDLSSLSQISGNIGVYIEAPVDIASSENKIYIEKIEGKNGENAIAEISFDDATKAATIIDGSSAGIDGYKLSGNDTKIGIAGSHVYYGTFRYDCYKAVFGGENDCFVEQKYSGDKINYFIEKGWMVYDAGEPGDTSPEEFYLTELGEKYCPLREVISQRYEENVIIHDGTYLLEVTALKSNYRQLYDDGILAVCTPPKFIFGTDANGKDFFKMVFSGLLTSLGLGFLSAGINIVIGLIYGAISGYFGGWTDLLMERFVEILGGMPWIVMMTLIVLLAGHSSFGIFLLALCITGWIGVASLTRSQFYRYKGREYVLASRTLGASDFRLIFRHILPNGLGTIVTSAVLMIPSVIFTEANVSYLLPGALQLSGSFGVTLSNVQADLRLYPYLIVSASLVMALIMISFNLFGNGLRDAFNPSLKGSDD